MALSDKERKILRVAIADSELADSIADQIDAGSNVDVSGVDELGATDDLVGVDGSGDNAAPLVETEARLDAIEAKLDELIAALKG